MIGECQAMSPADKYAAYLKGFKPFSVKRKIYNPRSSSDEQSMLLWYAKAPNHLERI